MKPAVYTYPAPEKFTVYFRGYVKEYKGATVITHSCTEVRQNKFVALEDAKKLIKKLKKQICQKKVLEKF
jgi:hypothetical protein